ncbi:hypothetical protein HY501_03145, partial [Candidatus Woesearchaeota archaeon]|nr:hypothetical protein [Candidatus Woesearchaeota archaeon]
MDFWKTVDAIKDLRVQGATNVALAAADALVDYAWDCKAETPKSFLNELSKAKRVLESTRTTEPEMRNLLKYITHLSAGNDLAFLKEEVGRRKNLIVGELHRAGQDLVRTGVQLLKKGSVVYTHCHSTTVTKILVAGRAKLSEVHSTETRPRLQGRLTAEELLRAGVRVAHYVDSAVELALQDADFMLIGADAVDNDGIFNKIGSATFSKLAREAGIPVYVCCTSFKVDSQKEQVEMRDPAEVWELKHPRLRVVNPAFDKVEFRFVNGVVSELGILKPKSFF